MTLFNNNDAIDHSLSIQPDDMLCGIAIKSYYEID